MSPHYETDRDAPTYVPKEQWFTSPAKAPRRAAKREDKAMQS
jgi:hypothetical protein